MAVTLIRQAPTATSMGTTYARADEAVNDLLRFRAQVGELATLAAELEAQYGLRRGLGRAYAGRVRHRSEAAGLFGGQH